jgi:hypothetical protein
LDIKEIDPRNCSDEYLKSVLGEYYIPYHVGVLQICPHTHLHEMENSQDSSDTFRNFAIRMSANYKIHNTSEVDEYVDNITIRKHQIEQ